MPKFVQLSLAIRLLFDPSILLARSLAISKTPEIWKLKPRLRKFCRQQFQQWPSHLQQQVAMNPRVTFYHLHIPKAAGESFAQDMRQILTASSFTVDSHEGCYGDSPHAQAGVVVMLRHPRAHVLSQYSFCKTSADRGPKQIQELMPATLEAWLWHWKSLRASGEASRDFSGKNSEHNPPWCSSTPFGCYNPVDLQSHRMSCERPHSYTKESDDIAAIRNMQAAYFLGLVEAYHESLCLLYAKVHGGTVPEWCDCKNSAQWRRTSWSHSISHGAAHLNESDVGPEILADVDALTAKDQLLYAAAVRRFVQEVREIEVKSGTTILCEATAHKLTQLSH